MEKLGRSTPPLVIILMLGTLLWGGEYLRRDLMAPDEARFALVSQEMREGHWLVPFRQGEYYAHKPPLMFWLTNAFSVVTGFEIGRVAPRLPSFLGAVMALWAATQLAGRWFGVGAAWWTLLLLPTSFLFWNKGGFGQIDMLLCGLEMMALYCLFTAQGARRLMLAYTFMGLGILAKGPVGLIVPMGAYVTAMLASGSAFPRPRHHWVWGPLLALSFPAVWLLAIWIQGAPEGFFEELLIKQNVERAAGEFGGHVRPWHYFMPYYLVDFLPWTLLLPAAWVALGSDTKGRQHRRLLFGWVFFVLIFFSLSGSKRNLYILLAYPANAILIAGSLAYWGNLSERWRKGSTMAVIGLLGLLGLIVLAAPFSGQVPFNSWPLIPVGVVLLAGTFLAWRARGRLPGSPAWLRLMAGAVLIAFAWIGVAVYPEVNGLKTPRELAEPASRLLGPGERLIAYRMHGEIFSLYAGRKGVMAFEDAKMLEFIEESDQTHHLIVALASDLPDLQTALGGQGVVHTFQSGSKAMVWIELTTPPGWPDSPEAP